MKLVNATQDDDAGAAETALASDAAICSLLRQYHHPDATALPREEFSAGLLAGLKRKLAAENAGLRPAAPLPAGADRAVAHLLSRYYIPDADAPDAAFAARLLETLRRRAKNPDVDSVGESSARADEEYGIARLLRRNFSPVEASPAFRRHLLEDLQRHQRHLTSYKRLARRRAVGGFGAGAISAAAAMLIFGMLPSINAAFRTTGASRNSRTASTNPSVSSSVVPGISVSGLPPPAAFGALALAPPSPALDSFNTSLADPLPVSSTLNAPLQLASLGADGLWAGTAESSAPEGMEMSGILDAESADDVALHWPAARADEMVEIVDLDYRAPGSADWKRVEKGMVRLAEGARFRTVAGDLNCGLAFEDGTKVGLNESSVLRATGDGFRLESGRAYISVPREAPALAWVCDERDLALEPGTTAMFDVGDPSLYAAGGSPAPRVAIMKDGLAFARGRLGVGIGVLYPDHIYSIDHYVTAEIPGRPLCGGERETIVDNAPASVDVQGLSQGLSRVARQIPAVAAADHPAIERGFVRLDGKWVDPDYRLGLPTRQTRYLSPKFLSLLRRRRDLAGYLSLGRGIIFRDGNGFHEIT